MASIRSGEYAYERLRREILDGHWTPGQRLIEEDIATRLGVSRSTVRLALVRLQQEGFVELAPNRGAKVRSLTLDDAVSMMQVREALQGLAARLAAEGWSEHWNEELSRLVNEMSRAGSQGDLMLYVSLNARFHDQVVECAGNPNLQRMLAQLSYPMLRFQFRTLGNPGSLQESLGEAKQVLAALQQGNGELAEATMRSHLARSRQRLTETAGLWETTAPESDTA